MKPSITLLAPLIMLALTANFACADQFEGAISKSEYKEYIYIPFSFSLNTPDQLTAALSSPESEEFELYLRSPEGRVYSTEESQNAENNRIVITTPTAGNWTAVVRAAGYSSGTYTLSLSTAKDIREINDENQKSQAIKSVLDQKEIERLEGEERSRADDIQRLIEQLSLPTFRTALLAKLKSSMPNLDDNTQKELHAAEEREARLSHALKETENLDSRDLVQALIQDALKDTEGEITRGTEKLASDASLRATFAKAEQDIRALNGSLEELARLEEALIRPKENEDFAGIRRRIAELRDTVARAERELALKLIDSYIVKDMRFGGLEILPNKIVRSSLGGGGGALGGGFAHFGGGGAMGGGFAHIVGGASQTIVIPGTNFVNTDIWLPKFFPWPPPEASSRLSVDRQGIERWLGDVKTLGDLNEKLDVILSDVGYTSISYFGVPAGFALVTQMEHTDESGVPYNGAARWAITGVAVDNFSILSYLKMLFTSPPGYYRVIVFIVSDKEFAYQLTRLKFMLVEQWSRDGLTSLPNAVAAQPLSNDHHVVILVYEFEKDDSSADPNAHIPGRHTAKDHLAASGVVMR